MRLNRTVRDGALILSDGQETILTIQEEKKDNAFHILLDGKLQSDVVHDLQDELNSLVIMGFDLRIDLQKVRYISSSCARVFLDIQILVDKNQKGSVTLCNVPAEIMQQLESTGMTELLIIE